MLFRMRELLLTSARTTKRVSKRKAALLLLGCFHNKKLTEDDFDLQTVFCTLLYGRMTAFNEFNPMNHELILVDALLRKVGPHLSFSVLKTIEKFSRTHEDERMRELMKDLHTFAKNAGWK